MTIDELIENFQIMDDWEDRYRYLIDLGSKLPVMDDSLKTDSAKVKGCMSQVWLLLGWDGQGRLTMLSDSDAQIVKGLIAVLNVMVCGKKAAEINLLNIEKIFSQLGMEQHLSPNRRNGFFSMVERVKGFCSTFQ